jgi:hypothetical protein
MQFRMEAPVGAGAARRAVRGGRMAGNFYVQFEPFT